MSLAVEICNVDFSYEKESVVIQNLSVGFKAGSYTVVLGHNGSGKSTLAKLIIGLLEPDSGEIYVDGKKLTADSVYDIRNKIGIVFQNPDNQFIGATVEDDIAFGLENHCVEHSAMKAIIDEYAQKVGMLDSLNKEPSHLSGGQKQRVAIAGVLAMAPDVIIFDEATSMLDPKGRADIKELIHKMREIIPNITVISITHDVEEAFLADEVIILNRGHLYAQGKPSEIFAANHDLKSIDLDEPFSYKLNEALIKNGIHLDTYDEEEMVKKLCQ